MRIASGMGVLLLVLAPSCAEPSAPPQEPSVGPPAVESALPPPVAAEPPPAAPPAPVAGGQAAEQTPAPAPQLPPPAATAEDSPPPAAIATSSPPPAADPTAAVPSTGKPCPTGRCSWQGRCVKPGGPIARPGAAPDEISGLCGGDGGPCRPCRCASPDTPIDTPRGAVAIKAIHVGDEVYSIHQGKLAVVRVIAVQQVPVTDHAIVRMRLTNGALLELSGYHPLGDGRTLFDLAPGQELGGAAVEALALVPYEQPFTYDILPGSDTGTYFARGVWLGSTMFGVAARP